MTTKITLLGLVQIIDNMNTTILSDGTIKYRTDDWTGYRNPSEPMTKTKWYKDGIKYWEVKGSNGTYIVSVGPTDLLECECLGFLYRKKCKHLMEVVNKIRKNSDEV